MKSSLEQIVAKATSSFLAENRSLERIANQGDQLSTEQWKQFGIQRYILAMPFIRLLRAGIEAANSSHLKGLADALQENLQDEVGNSESESHAHETYRQQFYFAMGISKVELHPKHALEGTKQYLNFIENMIQEANPYRIAGAVLALEATVLEEFKRIQVGRDKKFPAMSQEARYYLDDHVSHDAEAHYPHLFDAIAQAAHDEESFDLVKTGIESYVEAKSEFYKSLETILF